MSDSSSGNKPTETSVVEEREAMGQKRELTGRFATVVSIIAIGFALYELYCLLISPPDPWILRCIHVALVLVIGFLIMMPTRRSPRQRVQVVDIILACASIGVAVYVILEFDRLVWCLTWDPTTADVVVATILILLVLELTRRTVGLPMVIIAVVFLAYSWLGQFMPGFLWQRGYPWARTAGYLLSFEGLYGMVTGISATFIFMFILFGALLRVSGAGDFMISFAYSIAGRMRGGPAKVAVLASSLMGTISGSAVANVVTTGSLTIPLMKKVGYKPTFAGAVEAVASTGGQIMPPVMGAGAFIMAEMIGQPYGNIIIAVAIPAILYYIAVFWMVDAEAVKLNLSGVPKDQLPKLKQVIRRGWVYFIPLLALVWVLVIQRASPVRAAAIAMATAVVVSWVIPEARMTPKRILRGLEKGATDVVTVASVCIAAGIIIGVIMLTGVGLKFGALLEAISGGYLPLALFLSMIVCLVLGMGLPTTAAYCVVAVVVAPGLVLMGVPPLAAHLFVFFFAVIGPITPPVAIASYAGASIAGADPTKVGWTALKLGLAAFIIPYAFVYKPGLLLGAGVGTILLHVVMGLTMVFALVFALQGFILTQKMTWMARAFFFASALLLAAPGSSTDSLGFVAFAVGFSSYFIEWRKRRRQALQRG